MWISISVFAEKNLKLKIYARAIIEENKIFEILHFIGKEKCMK